MAVTHVQCRDFPMIAALLPASPPICPKYSVGQSASIEWSPSAVKANVRARPQTRSEQQNSRERNQTKYCSSAALFNLLGGNIAAGCEGN